MDWLKAISRIPPTVPWLHRGRNPTVGLDCIGLVLCVYRLAGIDLSDLDVPYGRRDYLRFRRSGVLAERLRLRFDEVPAGWAIWDGDVLVLRMDCGTPSHAGVVAGGLVWQMTDKGLTRSSLARTDAAVDRVFRFRG